MANKNAFADFVDNWAKLLTNVAANAAELPDLTVYTAALEPVLEEVKARGARQMSRRGVKQQGTEELQEMLREGRIRAAKLRSALRAHYGYQSPRLLEYDIKPLPAKKRRPGPPPPEEPQPEGPATASPEVQPAAQGTEPSKSNGSAPQPDPSPQTS